MNRPLSCLFLLLLSSCLITDADHADWIDQDGDGFLRDVDCDDADDQVGDGSDWYLDADGDGYAPDGAASVRACAQPSGYAEALGDCDDGDADAYPGGEDSWYDGVDGDCDGADDFDQDGDGWPGGEAGDDCDDEDPDVNPSAVELVDDVDNNCDGDVDFLDLANADAVMLGELDGDLTGQSVAGVGDIDGDGFDDLLIGTDHAANTDIYGKAFLVYGPVDAELDLGNDAVTITGHLFRDKVGYKVAAAGDTDGDGRHDFLVGGHKAGDDSSYTPGEAYLFLGAAGLSDMGVEDADLIVQGVNDGDQLGYELGGGGDLDGDGLADIALTAVGYSGHRGRVYLGLGASAHRGQVSADGLDAAVTGLEGGDRSGRGLAMGDMDGDGYDDLALGAKEHDAGGSSAGAAFVLSFGGYPSSRGLEDADATFLGEMPNALAGGALAFADLTGDGYDDLLVGSETVVADDRSKAGSVYLLIGGTTLPSGTLRDAPTRLDGDEDCRLGRSLDVLEDFDGDGLEDLLVGAPECAHNGDNAGVAVVLTVPFDGVLGLADASFILAGEGADHSAGWSVASAGDVDADSFTDVLVGAPDEGGGGPGRAYLFYGREL
jgi:hypothetical protein